jgi:hypothetical protein
MDSVSCQDDRHDALNDGEQCQPPKPGSAYPPAASEPTHWPLSYPPAKSTKPGPAKGAGDRVSRRGALLLESVGRPGAINDKS